MSHKGDLGFPSLNDSYLWVNTSSIPHILHTGQVKRFFSLINDISNRKAVERMKDEFVSAV